MIYRDASLGNRLHISVAKLLILKESETFASKEQSETVSASDMLKAFCKWQTVLTKHSEGGSLHYDAALLLTRVNICRAPVWPSL